MFEGARRKLFALMKRHKLEAELDDELRYHIDKALAQNIARGMSPDEARRAALVGFGGVQQQKERCRDSNGFRWVDELLQDLRFGARVLRRSPGFTFVVVLMLGLGVGANTAVFSLVDKLLLRSLPVSEPDRLVRISAESVNPKFLNTIFSYPDYVDYRDRNQVFDGLLAHSERNATIGQDDHSKRILVSFVSWNYFSVLGTKEIQGRGFVPDEERPDAPVAVISNALWSSLGADPAVLGKPINVSGTSLTVVGIAPKDFSGVELEYPVDVWVPLTMMRPVLEASLAINDRRTAWLALMGRMKPGLDPSQARAGLESVAQSVFLSNTPESDRGLPFNEKHILLEPGGQGSSYLRTQLGAALKLMTGLAALLLLIACANVAGLLLARAAGQRREIAIRLALGASRGRLIRLLFAQSGLLAVLGSIAGLALAPSLHRLLLAFEPGVDVTRTVIENSLDLRVLAFTLAVSVLCGVLSGLGPALQSSRPEVIPALKDSDSSRSRKNPALNLRSLLVAGQVAVAMLMLVGSVLLVRTLRNLLAIDPGFTARDVVCVPLNFKAGKSDEDYGRIYNALVERLSNIPSITGVTTAQITPLTGSVGSIFIHIEGYQQSPGANLGVDYNEVGPGYHEMMGVGIIKGRGFTDRDRAGAGQVTIVNETFAQTFFAGRDPIGDRIQLGGTRGPWMQIVGVARDVRAFHLSEPAKPHIDLPVLQHGYGPYNQILVRSTSPATSIESTVLSAAKELDPSANAEHTKRMRDIVTDSIAPARMASTLTGLFGLIALLLAVVGLYGAMSYWVGQSRREIGIRMALGASRHLVLRTALARGVTLMTIGIAIGLAAALAASRLIVSLLYEVKPGDWFSYVGAALALMLTGFLACYLPARRAASADPMIALRFE